MCMYDIRDMNMEIEKLSILDYIMDGWMDEWMDRWILVDMRKICAMVFYIIIFE